MRVGVFVCVCVSMVLDKDDLVSSHVAKFNSSPLIVDRKTPSPSVIYWD